jgi:medium-chain acyl-[acyl-carrier-protein] hydrolase
MSKRALFYFPYAGASSVTLHHWKKQFEKGTEFIPIDYAGHGKLRRKEFYTSIEEACLEIYDRIKDEIENYDCYYLGGHCIGAIIAYEFYYFIRNRKEIKLPQALFLSGQGAPDKVRSEMLSRMDNNSLLMHLYEKGTIQSDMLDEEIREYVDNFVLAPVRADAMLLDNYIFTPKEEPVKSRISILYGNSDRLYSDDDFKQWSRFAERPVHYYCFDGGHYFINDKTEEYIEGIKKNIEEYDEAAVSQAEGCC